MSLNARTASSSYSMSAGVCRATMRQKRQPFTPAIIRRSANRIRDDDDKGAVAHGYVSEVQAEDPQERQSREARLHVVPQELPRSSVDEVLSAPKTSGASASPAPPAGYVVPPSSLVRHAAPPLTASVFAAP